MLLGAESRGAVQPAVTKNTGSLSPCSMRVTRPVTEPAGRGWTGGPLGDRR